MNRAGEGPCKEEARVVIITVMVAESLLFRRVKVQVQSPAIPEPGFTGDEVVSCSGPRMCSASAGGEQGEILDQWVMQALSQLP